MKLTIRLVGAIWLSVLIVIGGFAFLQIREERERLVDDLKRRAVLVGEGLKEAIEPQVARDSTAGVERILKKFGTARRGIAVYDRFAGLMVATPDIAPSLPPSLPEVTDAVANDVVSQGFRVVGVRRAYVYATPLTRDDRAVGALVVILDAAHLEGAAWNLWWSNALRFLALALVVSLIALVVVRSSVTQPMAKMSEWTKSLRAGRYVPPPDVPDANVFGPLAREVAGLARSMQRARAAAEQEAALRLVGESIWTEERLKQFVNLRLAGRPLVVVSNREPVSHVRKGGRIQTLTPASGLVTAMGPVMRVCGGVWVAHGSGDADVETADARGRLGLPEDDPRYTLRRVWLTKEEEQGYYYGFANEGLWPLCHIVHTRPTFRPDDFAHYQAANRKFAETVLSEIRDAENPLVLIQDYHFALLPALVKAERPDARVAIFWHIPWPNFEAFGICPWQRELLEGMLGADLISFHIQSHCDNFLETVNRALESRVEWERFAVNREGHLTVVRPFPISVAPAEEPAPLPGPRSAGSERETLFKELGVEALYMGVGVDRVDYTKGILERFLGVERFLDRYPRYKEKFTFVQIVAPSRTHIRRYHEFLAEVEAEAERINWRFQTDRWKPIAFLKRHHSHEEISRYYRAADLCLVTSLHDGMNLVAKEVVACRHDEDAVLILSRFTGACREMRDALVVNPYDIEEMSESIRFALEMDVKERRARMQRMRRTIKEQNIYRWAGNLIAELCEVRPELAESAASLAKKQISNVA